jgi:catechol 2,3-dioxygenase-like lactoylglutathione lyase family enzyme
MYPTRDEPGRCTDDQRGEQGRDRVADQDRAKAFWTETMGLELVQDQPYGDEHWLEGRADWGVDNDTWVGLFRDIADRLRGPS